MSDWNKTIQEMFASPELDKAQPALALIEAAYKEGWHTANDSAPWGSSSADHFCQKSWEDSEAIAALSATASQEASRVQEPVAWMMPEHIEAYRLGEWFGLAWANYEKTEAYTVPLYATPPAPQPALALADWSAIVDKLIEDGLPEYFMTDDRGLDRDEYAEWFAKAYALANAASQDGGRDRE